MPETCNKIINCYFNDHLGRRVCEKFPNQSCNIDNCLLAYDAFRIPLQSKNIILDTIKNCNMTRCNQGEYLCKFYKYCIKINQYCDGIDDCLYGDDEFNCESKI